MWLARISLTLSRHFYLSFIALGRSSGLHPVFSHSCWMYVRAGRPAFARPYVGVHKSTSIMSSSLLLQQCPACLVRLTWIVFVMRGRWLVGCCRQEICLHLKSRFSIKDGIEKVLSPMGTVQKKKRLTRKVLPLCTNVSLKIRQNLLRFNQNIFTHLPYSTYIAFCDKYISQTYSFLSEVSARGAMANALDNDIVISEF